MRRKKQKLKKYIDIVKNTPDLRSDKIEKAKKNLETYFANNVLDEKIAEKIADRILQALL